MMSKVLYEVRNGTHVQWSLDKSDLSIFTEGKVIPQLQGVKAKKLKFDSYKKMVDHMSSVLQMMSYLRNRGHA